MHSLVKCTAAALNGFRLPIQKFAWGPNAERLIANAGRPARPRS
jgi:hypothetical protein